MTRTYIPASSALDTQSSDATEYHATLDRLTSLSSLLNVWRTVASWAFSAFLLALRELLDWFGWYETEWVIGDQCAACRDVHGADTSCPREMARFCADCEMVRVLNYFGRCGTCNSASIDYRDPVADPRMNVFG